MTKNSSSRLAARRPVQKSTKSAKPKRRVRRLNPWPFLLRATVLVVIAVAGFNLANKLNGLNHQTPSETVPITPITKKPKPKITPTSDKTTKEVDSDKEKEDVKPESIDAANNEIVPNEPSSPRPLNRVVSNVSQLRQPIKNSPPVVTLPAAKPQTPKKPQPSLPPILPPEPTLEQILTSGGNNHNLTHYKRNGTDLTTFWVAGVDPPPQNDWQPGEANSEFYQPAQVEFKPTWFDIQPDPELNPPTAQTSAANLLHWWLEQNRKPIANFLEDESNGLQNHPDFGQMDVRQFINLTTPQQSDWFNWPVLNQLGNESTSELINLFLTNCSAQPSQICSGFLAPIVTNPPLAQQTTITDFPSFTNQLRQNLALGHGIALELEHPDTSREWLTIWGADYSHQTKPVALYVTQPDDQLVPTLKRLPLESNSANQAKLTTPQGDALVSNFVFLSNLN